MKITQQKIGPYTILVEDAKQKIYFYPSYAQINEEVDHLKSAVSVLFEVEETKEPEIYCMYTKLLNRDEEEVFNTYSVYLYKLEEYKYQIIDNYEINQIEYNLKETIDLANMDSKSFLTLLTNNSVFQKMIPEFKKQIELSKEDLANEKDTMKVIDIPSQSNYFQNVSGYLVNEIEHQVAIEDEQDISKEILKNIRKTHDIVLFDKKLCNIAYLSLYANILAKTKSSLIEPESILETKDLKPDTNKTSLSKKDLDEILYSFINNLKQQTELENNLNIIQERIDYELKTKPRISEFTNHIKVILCDDKYIDDSKRIRAINENHLKELIIKSLKEHTYRPLPRNEVLLYNIEQDNIDFCAIISLDLILNLLKTYKLNSSDENKQFTDLLKTLENMIVQDKHKRTNNTLQISILTYLMINLYYYNNINKNILLFNKGQNIINLDYKDGGYDISIINRTNNRLIGKLSKITEETKNKIKESLEKNEKSFNLLINKIILLNIDDALSNMKIAIDIKEISHKNIFVMFNRSLKKDIFRGKFSLEELLITLTSLKTPKEKIEVVEEEETKPKDEYICGIIKEDYEYITRKSNTIYEIMNTTPIKDKKYNKIFKIYKKFKEEKDKKVKQQQLLDLGKLLGIEGIKIEEEQ